MTFSRRSPYAILFASFFCIAQPAFTATQADGMSRLAADMAIVAPDQLDLLAVGTVTGIPEPNLVTLSDGKSYRMSEIRVPVYYGEEATKYLRTLLLHKKIGVYGVKKAKDGVTDNHGNTLGHLVMEDASWVQRTLVRQGLAWVYGSEHNHLFIKELLKDEQTALSKKVGFWANPDYAVKTLLNVQTAINSFALYQGKIDRVEPSADSFLISCDTDPKGRAVLTFRVPRLVADTINTGVADKRGKPSTAPTQWKDSTVRLHGWIEKSPATGRPLIEVSYPEQLEFMNPETSLPLAAAR